ncbi:hypothetical protein CISG_01042 [Coccidioides immitis RMSCC 3703]|uniref:Uncharacterized protein n=1 Tax=Coccidioides immitis RMSCC 3703 TaxID=454286 RepID=A0A0J8QUZ0_COCIT|nr:hypothetical protein CISG_01042 [Coccidioides immitis RMSCC 3703]
MLKPGAETLSVKQLALSRRSQEDEVGVGRWDERFSLQEYPAGTEPELGGSVKSAVDSACPATRPVGCSYSRIGPSIHSAPPCLGPLVDFTIKSPADFSPPSVEPETAAISIQFSVQDADVQNTFETTGRNGKYECVL